MGALSRGALAVLEDERAKTDSRMGTLRERMAYVGRESVPFSDLEEHYEDLVRDGYIAEERGPDGEYVRSWITPKGRVALRAST